MVMCGMLRGDTRVLASFSLGDTAELAHVGRARKSEAFSPRFQSVPSPIRCLGPGADSLPGCKEQKLQQKKPVTRNLGKDTVTMTQTSLGCISRAPTSFWTEPQLGIGSFSHGPLRIVHIQTVTHDSVHLS